MQIKANKPLRSENFTRSAPKIPVSGALYKFNLNDRSWPDGDVLAMQMRMVRSRQKAEENQKMKSYCILSSGMVKKSYSLIQS